VPAGRIEVGRLDHPAVQRNAVRGLELEELGGLEAELTDALRDGAVLRECARETAVGGEQARGRWRAGPGPCVHVVGEAGAHRDVVCPGLLRELLDPAAAQRN